MYLGGSGGFKIIGTSLSKPHIGELSITRVCVSSGGGGVADLVRVARKHLRYVGNVFAFKLYSIQYHVHVRNSLTVSHRRLIGRTREKDCMWSSRAAEQHEARQARLESKHACARVRRMAEQPGARQTRLERRHGLDRMNNRAETRPARLERYRASRQPEARQARRDRQREGIRNRRVADLVFPLSNSCIN